MAQLLLLIAGARGLGALLRRWGHPALVGELLAGILLGPAFLGLLAPSPALNAVADVAVFLIVLGAGLKMGASHVLRGFHGRGLGLLALNFGLPFAGGVAVGWAWGLSPSHVALLGVCVSITALPVAVRMLEALGLLQSLIARYALAAAVSSDILALLILSGLLSLSAADPGGAAAMAPALGGALLKLGLLCAALGLAHAGLRRLAPWSRKAPGALEPAGLFSLAALFALAFAALSEALGFPGVVGAFFAALLLREGPLEASALTAVETSSRSISEGFLGPVFFASLGLHFSPSAFADPGFLAAVLAVGVLSKLLAGRWGGALAGLEKSEAWALGAILNGRGVMELVVAETAYRRGLADARLFSVLLLLGTLTTLLAPLLYGFFRPLQAPNQKPPATKAKRRSAR